MTPTTTSDRGARRWAAPLAAALIVALPVAGIAAPAVAGARAAAPTAALTVAAPAAAVQLGERTLQRGDRGKDVRKLQKLLAVKKTGYFNKKTGKAVRKVERKYGLAVDTVVDAATLQAIQANAQAKAKAKRAKKASRSEARGGSAAEAKRFARAHISDKYGWGDAQMDCLVPMWNHESGWNYRASNPNGRYHGIPQTSSAVWSAQGYSRDEYMGSAAIQVKVGAKYIDSRYGSPCQAWAFWQSHHWY